jgi:hypothetical protein
VGSLSEEIMSDGIDVGRFWIASGLNPAQGLRGPMLGAGISSVRAYIGNFAPTFRTIFDFFTDEDGEHMVADTLRMEQKINLRDYDNVRQRAEEILVRVSLKEGDPLRMPPNAPRWSQLQIDFFDQWIAAGMPP